MRKLVIKPVVAVVTAVVASVGVWTGLSYASDSAPVAARSHASTSTNSPPQWFVTTNDYAMRAQAMHQSGPDASAPHIAKGPRSVALETSLATVIRPYISNEISAIDIGSGPYAVGQVTWQTPNGGVLTIAIQKLTAPLPVGVVAGSDSAPVRGMPNGTTYLTIDNTPFFRQVVMVKRDGTCINITNAGIILQGIKPTISMTDLIAIAHAANGISRL